LSCQCVVPVSDDDAYRGAGAASYRASTCGWGPSRCGALLLTPFPFLGILRLGAGWEHGTCKSRLSATLVSLIP
jgi:hypothetical protein